ncbi:MAG TPA: aquaporin [Candidatus Saccharimonadales bacterium]|nr:aquaporin [Candidatus Saccharimonadales bacterium]
MAVKVAKTDFKKILNSEDIRLGAMFAELIGTFVLTCTILVTSTDGTVNTLIAVLAYLIMWLVISQLSGSHMNPAVTLGLLSVKQITPVKAMGYIIAQVIGAILALIIVMQFLAANPLAAGVTPFEITGLTDQSWLPVLSQFMGALVFGFGIGSVFLGKKQGFDAAFTAGGSFLIGLLIASIGSAAILNPAVAIGVNAFTNNWSTLVYAVAPLIGIAIGIWGYKALLWEVTSTKAKN